MLRKARLMTINVKTYVLVNNDIKIAVNLKPNQKATDLTFADISAGLAQYSLNPPLLKQYYLLNTVGDLQLDGNVNMSGSSSHAGFCVEYVNSNIDRWSLFVRTNYETLLYLDNECYTDEKFNILINEAYKISGWDDGFVEQFMLHSQNMSQMFNENF
jgi:hypothetical protein